MKLFLMSLATGAIVLFASVDAQAGCFGGNGLVQRNSFRRGFVQQRFANQRFVNQRFVNQRFSNQQQVVFDRFGNAIVFILAHILLFQSRLLLILIFVLIFVPFYQFFRFLPKTSQPAVCFNPLLCSGRAGRLGLLGQPAGSLKRVQYALLPV